ncbi:MAG: proteasome subunit beta [Candidatus Pacearchaeota archaeon]
MDIELKNSILKSGTTILGIVCKDGIVMASDRQTTAGTIVLNKNSQKTVKINDYIVISGTGMVSDIKRIEKILPAELKLKELRSKKKPSVKQAANLLAMILYSGIREPSMIPMQAGFLIGGLNEDGTFELYSIEPAGSVTKVEDYDANFGSGMTFVLGFLERQYKPGISVKEGIELAIEAIKSSTQRDIGSGYGIDVFTITKDGIKQVLSQEILPEYKETKK